MSNKKPGTAYATGSLKSNGLYKVNDILNTKIKQKIQLLNTTFFQELEYQRFPKLV